MAMMLRSFLYEMKMDFCGMMVVLNLKKCPVKIGWFHRFMGCFVVQICIAAGGFLEASPLQHFDSIRVSTMKPKGQSWRKIGT
ncbi:hypothetical protein SAY86_021111 [Trapa natans]|uniref:Uncharacterized protein n=1 Tax=Trapa natans TaxID=22666 RepID=A0AAN7M972_TRANT|nr:hypothetical protein SAY86_021111 [Trapa natans]